MTKFNRKPDAWLKSRVSIPIKFGMRFVLCRDCQYLKLFYTKHKTIYIYTHSIYRKLKNFKAVKARKTDFNVKIFQQAIISKTFL